MSQIEKINFPYFIKKEEVPIKEKMVVFFGTDFYNLPLNSNRDNYIIATNRMLDYIRKHFAGHRLLYQAHPNEKEELKHLNLAGFVAGEKKVAEVFLYENANKIEYVFSTCSWANGSAYAMGINSAVFLDLLKGAISDDSIRAYHSYFEGLPADFFITSFDDLPPKQKHIGLLDEQGGLNKIVESIGNTKKVWVLATDPALALRGAIIGRFLKEKNKDIKIGLVLISNNRWANIKEGQHLFKIFDEAVEIPRGRVIYSARPKRIIEAVKVSFRMRNLPIQENEALISFSNLMFEENCLLSYYPKIKKILFMESRWYFFTHEEQYKILPKKSFNTSIGQKFFSSIIEPILGLHRTIYDEFDDGKVLNFFRYRKPIEKVYDKVFVIMPGKK